MLLSEPIRLVPYADMLSEDAHGLIPAVNVIVRPASFEQQGNACVFQLSSRHRWPQRMHMYRCVPRHLDGVRLEALVGRSGVVATLFVIVHANGARPEQHGD